MSFVLRELTKLIANQETVRTLPTQELVSKDELIAVSNYTKSISFDVRDSVNSKPTQGRIAFIGLVSSEIGTGAVKLPTGTLYFFKADPVVAANAQALSAAGADHLNVIGTVPVVAADWEGDLSGAVANLLVDVPFPVLSNVFVAFKMDALSEFNSAAGDEEILQMLISCKASVK